MFFPRWLLSGAETSIMYSLIPTGTMWLGGPSKLGRICTSFVCVISACQSFLLSSTHYYFAIIPKASPFSTLTFLAVLWAQIHKCTFDMITVKPVAHCCANLSTTTYICNDATHLKRIVCSGIFINHRDKTKRIMSWNEPAVKWEWFYAAGCVCLCPLMWCTPGWMALMLIY